MKIAFLVGLTIGLIGTMLSIAFRNWYVSFIISVLTGIVPIMLASIFKNISIVYNTRSKISGKNVGKVLEDLDTYARILTAFALPNIVIGIFVYLVTTQGYMGCLHAKPSASIPIHGQ